MFDNFTLYIQSDEIASVFSFGEEFWEEVYEEIESENF